MNGEVGCAVIAQRVKIVFQPLLSSIRVNWEFSSNCGFIPSLKLSSTHYISNFYGRSCCRSFCSASLLLAIIYHCSGQKGIQATLRTVAYVWLFYYYSISRIKPFYFYNECKFYMCLYIITEKKDSVQISGS